MEDLIELIIGISITLVLIIIGFTAGTISQKQHIESLTRRRRALAHVLVTDLRSFPAGADPQPTPTIVIAEVVMGADYWKAFVGKLKKIIGGALGSYELLMYRARDEAVVRLMEQAQALGYDSLCNLRLDTADIAALSKGQQGIGMIGVVASATAYRRPRPQAQLSA